MSDVILIGIHPRCISRGQSDADFWIGIHRLFVGLHAGAQHINDRLVVVLDIAGQIGTGKVAVGGARESKNHHEIILFHARRTHWQYMLGFEGYILIVVGSWLPIRTRVNAQQGEVTRMPWPHPVIRIATEFSNAAGRRTHKAHIRIGCVDR